MATGRQVTYTLKVNSNASAILNQAEKDAVKFESSMWQVQKTLASFGVGLGATFLIDAAKSWTQGAADYESAMLRIKNSSGSQAEGIRNQLFINKEVDQFKLNLDNAVDSYGAFLFKIKNAHISSGQKNKLFEEILGVGKVAGLSEEKMKPVVNNIATMLAEGILEAKHLRALSYSHPQVLPYLADILGLDKIKMNDAAKTEDESTALQKFNRLLSSGKMTKAGVNSDVLLEAFDKYWNDVKDKIPETLDLVQSSINDLSNTWERFKNKFVLDNKEELVGFFHSLSDGVHFISEHEQELERVGSTIVDIIKLYAEWRIALLALQVPAGIIGFFANEQERLNNIFSVYGVKAAEVAEGNIALAESEEVVAEANIVQQGVTETYLEVLENQLISLQELGGALGEVSIQTDLFTDAQLINHSSFQRIFYDTELLNGELHRLQIGLEKNSYQGSLFTDSELEMASSIGTATEALALQNEQLELRNQILAQSIGNAAISDATNLAVADAGVATMGMGVAGGLSSAASMIMPVFITGMAIEVADSLFPQGKFSKTSMDWKDWLAGASQLFFIPGYDDKNTGFGKVRKIAEENREVSDLQSLINQSATGVTSNLEKNGQFLYSIIKDSPLLDKIDPIGKTGKRVTDDWLLYDLLKRNFDLSKYSFSDSSATDPNGATGSKTHNYNFGKDTNHLKGNSSNYFTFNVHEMNGIKTYTVKTDSNGVAQSDERVAAIAGDTFIKMLSDAVNDSQLLISKH